MSNIVKTEKLIQRISGLSLIEQALSVSLDHLINSYSGQNFLNSSVDKSIFFRECIQLELSPDAENLILNRCKLNFHKDARSSLDYGLDLVFGWLSEDIVLNALKKKKVDVTLVGEDRNREFLTAQKIGTSPDLLITKNGSSKYLEIVFSWNDHWKSQNKWDLRESKFRHLTKVGEEALCMGIELPSMHGFIVDMAKERSTFLQKPNPAWGNKTVYTKTGIQNILHPLQELMDNFTELTL